MKNLIVCLIAALICCSCTLFEKQDQPTSTKKPQNKTVVGGWYPVFFDKYDQTKVDGIIDAIKDGHAKRITITYDMNEKLAEEITAKIQEKLNFAVEMKQVKNKDTKTLKYSHNKAVVTVFTRMD